MDYRETRRTTTRRLERGAALPQTDRNRQLRRLISTASELVDLAWELADNPSAAPDANRAIDLEAPCEDDPRWLDCARKAYRERRARSQLFAGEELFGEPVWDILLDLFIAAKEGKRVPVTSACIGSAVPVTTALRWIALMEDRGLIVREADPHDARRSFVGLSDEAYGKMVRYFAAISHAGGERGLHHAATGTEGDC